MNAKRCLLVKCKDLVMEDIYWGATEMGHTCNSLNIECDTLTFDEKEVSRIIKHIHQTPYDIVLTMNFAPTVSAACKKLEIPYAAWVYDCPLQSLYTQEAYNSTNHLFIFDKYLVEDCRNRGLPNLNYLPLAANISRMGQLKISPADEAAYSCDISFVGMQYIDSRYAFYRSRLDEPMQDKLNEVAFNMMGKWDGRDRIHNTMPDELIDAMLALSDTDPYSKLNVPNRVYFEENVIARAVAYTERRLMMEQIAELHPRWYGAQAEPKDQIAGVNYQPFLTYNDNLPKAYNLSKINLSTSLHSIFSGLPLRTFDIIGAGGFILTNYQPETGELFEIGKEIVVYHNFEEMAELAKFFLAHEDARMAILLAGYERVCRDYTYPVAVQKILDSVFVG
ncbi:CgeB family protein [Butyrivibrio sp. MC2021]|uniref:CgeB family protein n=1 Tax=Butyrivibrio sp. MC2021 TaxID=1408306 RepID=UPI000479677B|nr:DUF3880 domain-containing protein [Butyrivibrio sp. MC2021]